MAKAQQGGIITGGQLDPYVAQRMSQDKAASDNRVLESMRQMGETKRTEIKERGAGERQNQALAAQSASNDKDRAARERGAREERFFKNTQAEIRATFDNRQRELTNEFDLAHQGRTQDFELSLQKKDLAFERAEALDDRIGDDEARDLIIGLLERMDEKLQASAKLETSIDESRATALKNVHRVSVLRDSAKDHASVLLNEPALSGEFYKTMGEDPKKAYQRIVSPVFTEMKLDSTIAVDLSSAEGIINIEKRLASGELSSPDVELVRTTLDGIIEASKVHQGKLGTKNESYRSSLQFTNGLIQMRRRLDGLASSPSMIGDTDRTVGQEVREGLKTPREDPLETRAEARRRLQIAGGTEDSSILSQLRSNRTYPQLYEITDDMTAEEKEEYEARNRLLKLRYPDLEDNLFKQQFRNTDDPEGINYLDQSDLEKLQQIKSQKR